MLKFNEKEKLDSFAGALALRPQVEAVVDGIWKDGFDTIFIIGIGGTYASGMQMVNYMKGKSNVNIFVENAAEFNTNGNKRLSGKSIVLFSSVTGTTSEVVESLKVAKERGARVFGFIDVDGTPLGEMCDWSIIYPMNEQIKFFMVANRLMYLNGDFEAYDRYNAEMEKYLPQALVEVEKSADDFARAFAEKHHDDKMHYFVGAGNQWGATYSYSMCFWNEQHWRTSAAIHAAEFFHGPLELIERDTAVTVFVTEDEERPLAKRVVNFLPQVCANYTVIDAKDYELAGISPEFRASVSHLVMRGVFARIDVHMERINCHPMEIRRYYRRLDY